MNEIISYEPVDVLADVLQVNQVSKDITTEKIIKKVVIDISHPIHRIVKEYDNALSIFSDMEAVAAPSGEWAEYNYQYMIQESTVQTYEEVLGILNYDFSMHYDD